MNLVGTFLALSVLIRHSFSEEIYENSTTICQKCNCINGATFILDCQNRSLHYSVAEWPKHDVPLIATFSYNTIANLEVLPNSDKVTDLIFSHCGIQSMDNGVFRAVKQIQFVDLSYNYLTTEEIAPEKFKGPYNNTVYTPLEMTHLVLAYNKIHSLPHNIFEHLTNLRQLNLEGNHLKVLDPPTQMALSALIKLETLNLANNQLTELVGDAIKNLIYLKELDLSRNKLLAVPETLAYLGNSLNFVYLDYNPIFELTDESFLGVKSVIELSLTNLEKLTYVHAGTFAPIDKLIVLKLHSNKNLFDINSEAFGQNQTIQELYIQDNALMDLSHNLTKWSKLKYLNISGNNFICSCSLYSIIQDLPPEIKENKDGPVCVNTKTGRSLMVYNLTEKTCTSGVQYPILKHAIERHFLVIKIFTSIIIASLFVSLFIALIIVFLKYRRYRMNRNYPFTTQVWYNPLTNQPI